MDADLPLDAMLADRGFVADAVAEAARSLHTDDFGLNGLDFVCHIILLEKGDRILIPPLFPHYFLGIGD
jgi:hypothetical protein